MINHDKDLTWAEVSKGEYVCDYSPSGNVVDLQDVLSTLQKPLPSKDSGVENWTNILPTPPRHSYATDPPTEVLMRCAEKYSLERYTD